MKRSRVRSLGNAGASAVNGVTSSDSDDDQLKFITIQSENDDKAQIATLGAGDCLKLSELRRCFPTAVSLLLMKDDDEWIREPKDGIFKAPKKGWAEYVVYALSTEGAKEAQRTANASRPSSRPMLNKTEDKMLGVSGILARFDVGSFFELYASFRFAASGVCDMKKFVEYRKNAVQVYLQLILKLGPDAFDMSTLFRISEGDESICHALMAFVQQNKQCGVCKVKFVNATRALMHLASIAHGRKCLAKFQEPELLDTLLISARDMGFFRSNSNLPDSKTPFANPPVFGVDSIDSDDRSSTDDEAPSNTPANLPPLTVAPPPPLTVAPPPPLTVAPTPPLAVNSQLLSSANPIGSVPVAPPEFKYQPPPFICPPATAPGSFGMTAPSLFDHFNVNNMGDLLKLPTFRRPVRLSNVVAYKKFRRTCISNLRPFLMTVENKDVPIIYYLFQAHQSTTMLHDINKDFPKQCGCKTDLTMKHALDLEHIDRHPHTIFNELWCIVYHIAGQNEETDPDTSVELANAETMLHRIFKVGSKDELFQLQQFSENRFCPEVEFKIFRDIIYNSIVNLKDSRLSWLSPKFFSIDKLIFMRDKLAKDRFLSLELNQGRYLCSECGEELATANFYKHLLKKIHLNVAAFEKLMVAMQRLQRTSRDFTTFTRPKDLKTACIKERLSLLRSYNELSQRQQDEWMHLNQELDKRQLHRHA